MHAINSGDRAGEAQVADAALAPLEAGAATEADLQRQRMSVRVGEYGLLFPWRGGREVTPVPPASRIPNSAAWLRGLANVRGSLVPVVDAAAALGAKHRAGAAEFLLICGHGEASVGLVIDGLPRAFDLGAAQTIEQRTPLPAALEASAIARYRHEDQIWIDVDPDSLFDVLARNVPSV